MQQLSKQPAFELGQIVATPGALAALKKAGQQPGEFLTRHVSREWGDLSDEDRKENDYSLAHGFRLLSAFRTHAGDKLWIITESDRSCCPKNTNPNAARAGAGASLRVAYNQIYFRETTTKVKRTRNSKR